jgi:hypothetical protein
MSVAQRTLTKRVPEARSHATWNVVPVMKRSILIKMVIIHVGNG